MIWGRGGPWGKTVVEGRREQDACGETGCKTSRNWDWLDAGGERPRDSLAPAGGVDRWQCLPLGMRTGSKDMVP